MLEDNSEQSKIYRVMHMTEAPKKIEEVQSASAPEVNGDE
jgi:hypothetical protein